MPFEQCLRHRIALVAGAILIGSVSAAPSASATPVGDVANTVDGAVKSVQDLPSAAPSLPSATPPPTTVPAPTTAPAPAAPRVPVKEPAHAKPAPANSGVDAPSAGATTRAARNSAGAVTGTDEGPAKRAIPSARDDGGQAPAFPSGSDATAGKPTPGKAGSASGPPVSIRAAEVADLQRWFARVWPAIPLDGGEASLEWAVGSIARLLLRPAAAAIARVLSLPQSIAPAAGDSPFAGHSETAKALQPAPPDVPAAVDGNKTAYLVALTALLALLVLTIWREFRSVLRPGVR